jgi:hypothetical protein
MSESNIGKKMSYLSLHTTLFIPGLGSLGDKLPSPSKTLNLVITRASGGYDLNFNNGKIKAFVPDSNTQLAVYEPEAVVKV